MALGRSCGRAHFPAAPVSGAALSERQAPQQLHRQSEDAEHEMA